MPQYWNTTGPLTVVLTTEGLGSPRIEFIQRRYGNLVTLEGNRLGISKDGGCQQSVDSITLSFSGRPIDCMYLHYSDIDHIEDAAGNPVWEPAAAHA